MAEKTALVFWRIWALAAVVATAVPAARLICPERPAPGPGRIHSESKAASAGALAATAAQAPEVTEDALLARLAKAETGPERCSLCERLPASDDPRVTYAIASVLEHAHLASVRACATRALSQQPTAEARSWLVDLADDPQPEVRGTALDTLAASTDDAARSVVVEATHSEDPELRLSAVTALLKAGRAEGFEAAQVVLPSVEDRDALLTLLDALGESHDARALPVLTSFLASGERESHLHAIAALGEIGSALAVPALEPLLETGSAEEFTAAAEALGKLAPGTLMPKLRAELDSGDDVHQRLALSAILDSKEPDVAALAHEQLLTGDNVRARLVLQHLMRSPDPSFEADLVQVASSASPSLKRVALRALRNLDSPSARASADRVEGNDADPAQRSRALGRSLLALARDPSATAQAELMRSLDGSETAVGILPTVVALAPVSTVEQLIARSNGLDLESRRALLGGLAQRGEPRFAPALRAALGDPDSAVHDAALRGLVDLGDSSASQDVLRLSRASDAGERSLAIDLLSARTDEAATREIAALAGDSNMEVVCSALRALESRAPELVLQLATRAFHAGSNDDRASLLANLNGLRQSVLRPLSELALSEGDDTVAVAAVQSLTALEGPGSAQRLLAIASDANRSTDVRSAAAQGLRTLGGPLARSNHALLDTLSPADDPGAYTCNATQ